MRFFRRPLKAPPANPWTFIEPYIHHSIYCFLINKVQDVKPLLPLFSTSMPVLSSAMIFLTKASPFGNLVPKNATSQKGLETCSLLST